MNFNLDVTDEDVEKYMQSQSSTATVPTPASAPELEPLPADTKLTLEDLLRPEYQETMRNYLRIRTSVGKGIDDRSDEEVRDMYMSRMRDFETSDVGILNESIFANRQKDENRMITAKAYQLYDQVGNIFQSKGEGFQGFKDVAFGLAEHINNVLNPVSSPSTYLGLGAGKLATTGILKAGSATVRQGLVREAKKMGGRKAVKDSLVDEGIKKFTKKAVVSGVATSAAVDAALAVGLDGAYQDAKINIGVQDEYNKYQTGFMALTGLLGGGLDLLSRARTTKLSGLEAEKLSEVMKLKNYYTAPAKKKAVVVESALKNVRSWTDKVKAGKLIIEDGKVDGEALTVDFFRTFLFGDSDEGIQGMGQILREAGLDLGVNTKANKDKGITDIVGNFLDSVPKPVQKQMTQALNDSGIFVKLGMPHSKRNLSSLLSYTISKAGQELNMFSQLKKQWDATRRTGSKVYLQTVAEEEAALERLAKKNAEKPLRGNYLQNVWKRTVVSAFSTTMLNIKGLAGITAIKTAEDVAMLATLGIINSPVAMYRLLTGDVKGATKQFYSSTAIMKNQVQRLRNLLDPNATKEMFQELMKIDKDSAKTLNRIVSTGIDTGTDIADMAKRYKFKTEADIHLTNDKGKKLYVNSKGKTTTRETNKPYIAKGTVDNPNAMMLRTGEAYVGAAQKIMLVKTADTFMKSQAYIGNLDRLLRDKMDMSLLSITQKGKNESEREVSKRIANVFRSEDFLNVSAEATSLTLEDILSKSYKSNDHLLGKIAGAIEKVGDIPIIGTLFPFGKFFNNTVAFSYDIMGGGSIGAMLDLYRAGTIKTSALRSETKRSLKRAAVVGGGLSGAAAITTEGDDGDVQEFFEGMLRGASNYTLVGMAMDMDVEKMQKNLQWKDFEQPNGDIVNIQYDFPLAPIAILARYLNMKKAGIEVPKEFNLELGEQFGYGQLQRNFGKLGNVTRLIDQATAGEWEKVSETAATSVFIPASSFVSGMLRPLDPINRLAAYGLGEDAELMDARQSDLLFKDNDRWYKGGANRIVHDATRYVNNIFEYLGTEQFADSKRSTSKEGDILPQNIVGDIASFRTETPRTYTELLFNNVGIYNWRVDSQIKSKFPEADSMYKEIIQPELEARAKLLYKSKDYKEASQEDKKEKVKKLISNVKSSIKYLMDKNAVNNLENENSASAFINIREIYDVKNPVRKEAIKYVTGQDDLSIEQLKRLSKTSQGLNVIKAIAGRIKAMRRTTMDQKPF